MDSGDYVRINAFFERSYRNCFTPETVGIENMSDTASLYLFRKIQTSRHIVVPVYMTSFLLKTCTPAIHCLNVVTALFCHSMIVICSGFLS